MGDSVSLEQLMISEGMGFAVASGRRRGWAYRGWW